MTLRAEVGRAEITLGELGRLQPGDEIPLRAAAPEGYVVSIEGQPKFRAVRGSVGGRLAVQILERIEGLGGSR